ncbi:MAG: proteasome assembly chaperone family protein [Candidatus Hodarchaeota archaeon]
MGFTGAGLIGEIAVNHIIKMLQMKKIAYIKSKYISSITPFNNGLLRHPFRIYSHKEGTLCTIICEIPIASDGFYSITINLLDWMEEKSLKELVVLDGLAVRNISKKRQQNDIRYCTNSFEKNREFKERGLKTSPSGLIQGITGSILSECIIRKINGIIFFIPTFLYRPDPEGAAVLINLLNSIYNLDIGIQSLLSKIKEIEEKLKGIAEFYKKIKEKEMKTKIPKGFYI